MKKKVLGLLVLLGVYAIGYMAGFAFYFYFASLVNNLIVTILISVVIGAFVIFLVAWMMKNSFLTKPMWTVIPLAILYSMIIYFGAWNLTNIITLIIVSTWSIRRTIGFIINFKGLNVRDDEAQYIKSTYPKLNFIFKLFLMCLCPSILSYAVTVPLMYNFVYGPLSGVYNYLVLISWFVMIFGIEYSNVGYFNKFLYSYNKVNDLTKCNRIGIYKYARYPQIFGEIIFFIGCYLNNLFVFLGSGNKPYIFTFVGAACLIIIYIVLIIFVYEKYYKNTRVDFEDYKRTTTWFLPFRVKKVK